MEYLTVESLNIHQLHIYIKINYVRSIVVIKKLKTNAKY